MKARQAARREGRRPDRRAGEAHWAHSDSQKGRRKSAALQSQNILRSSYHRSLHLEFVQHGARIRRNVELQVHEYEASLGEALK